MSPSSLTTEKPVIRWLLTIIAMMFVGLFILLPVVFIVVQAFSKGIPFFIAAISSVETTGAMRLTLLVTAIAVPCNTVFGIAASWAITKFDFIGKRLLITLIELPFAVSPVISGLIYVLLLGANSVLGRWFESHDVQIIFAVPGLVIATIFVTFPFVARELIPLMQEQGIESEEAAIMLGASGWQTFWKVTLPSIKWGLFYGVLLSTARAMGEFGAVSVVSGHISGVTNTMPLHIEMLYNGYNMVGAFAVSSLFTMLTLLTLGLKHIIITLSRAESP